MHSWLYIGVRSSVCASHPTHAYYALQAYLGVASCMYVCCLSWLQTTCIDYMLFVCMYACVYTYILLDCMFHADTCYMCVFCVVGLDLAIDVLSVVYV